MGVDPVTAMAIAAIATSTTTTVMSATKKGPKRLPSSIKPEDEKKAKLPTETSDKDARIVALAQKDNPEGILGNASTGGRGRLLGN